MLLVGRGCEDHRTINQIDARLTKMEKTIGDLPPLQNVETRKDTGND